MGWSYFGIPGKRSHVDTVADLMSVNGPGVCFCQYAHELRVYVCHLMEKSADGLSTLLSLWRYGTVWPLLVCIGPWDGERLEFRPGVSEVRRVHGTVQIAT